MASTNSCDLSGTQSPPGPPCSPYLQSAARATGRLCRPAIGGADRAVCGPSAAGPAAAAGADATPPIAITKPTANANHASPFPLPLRLRMSASWLDQHP